MNKEKSIFACLEEVRQREIRELKEKLMAFGGEAHFGPDYSGEGATGVDMPYVAVHGDEGPYDARIFAVRIDKDGDLCIFGCPKDMDYPHVLKTCDIAYGHISFITESIPARSVNNQQLILETAVFMAWDMFDKMYKPNSGKGMFEVCHEIIGLAKEFESTRKYKVSDEDYDEGMYFEELDDFEKKHLDSINY